MGVTHYPTYYVFPTLQFSHHRTLPIAHSLVHQLLWEFWGFVSGNFGDLSPELPLTSILSRRGGGDFFVSTNFYRDSQNYGFFGPTSLFGDYSFWVRQLIRGLFILGLPTYSAIIHFGSANSFGFSRYHTHRSTNFCGNFSRFISRIMDFLGPPTHSEIVHFGSTNSFGDYLFWVHQLLQGLFILGPPTPSWIIHFGSTPSETLDFLVQ